MKHLPFDAGFEPRVHAISDRIAAAAAAVKRALLRPERPEAFREHDPKKANAPEVHSATPPHLLGSGARAEFFKLPRL